MSDPFAFWVFLALLSGTVAVIWLFTGRVRRMEDDVEASERAAEAAWISDTIESAGGDVPVAVVDQVLELHGRYLDGAASAADDASMQGHDARREPPEADVAKAG